MIVWLAAILSVINAWACVACFNKADRQLDEMKKRLDEIIKRRKNKQNI